MTKTRSTSSRDHVAIALAYCRDVVAGKITAGRLVRLACQRQLSDLERKDWNYRFDAEKAGRACRFFELHPHVKGPKAGELFSLEPWQCFIATTVFGWVRKDTGRRRFRRAYTEVPRGNGKSFMSSSVGNFGLAADGEEGAEVYSAATTTEQANIVRGDAAAMLRKRPDLMRKLGITLSTNAIFQKRSNSAFKALSREAKNQDGKNIHFAIVDELHAHPTRELWDVLVTGAAKRPQSLIWTITTAGVDTSGICYEVRDSVVKMLEGQPNEALFGVIYTLDDGDDWRVEENWIKANPNWNASIDHDAFRLAAIEATQSPAKENNFKTKHLNVWCGADVAWMQMDKWDACADTTLREDQFAKQPCVEGIDLASKIDIASKVRVFWRDLPRGDKVERHFYAFASCYLPEQRVRESRNAQIPGWVKQGFIRTTPGDVIDFEVVKDDLKADAKAYDVREVAFDPWQAQQMANELNKPAGPLTMVELRATVQNFSEPMKAWEALVREGRFHHDGNPAFRWMVSNVVCHVDAKENIYPRKQVPENKIDAAVACIMAMNRALLAPAAPAKPQIRVW